ncbi:MAG: TonB-dependent receptor [Pseudoxanthomonas suwonensis]|nr:TonB-dependent receptor [Pseudoxanthomonas suwonensis]
MNVIALPRQSALWMGLALCLAGQADAAEPGTEVADENGNSLPAESVDAPPPTSTELDRVVITGSNIRRTDIEQIVPVTVINREQMEVRNAVLPVDLLTSLPYITSLPENETRLGSSGARGDNANINLRNMGATATLILVNGRRMAINPMTAGLSQAVNVNHLPTRGVERIEVLRDGASAIYGSDAVGGVINYVLRKQFDGVEVTLRHDQPEQAGGSSSQAAVSFGSGFSGERGRLYGTIDALYREAIWLRDRDFSRSADSSARAPAPFGNPGGPFDGRSARGHWPTFRIGSATANNYFRPIDGVPTLTSSAPDRASDQEFFLDLNQFGFAAPRVRRGNLYLSAEFDINPDLTAYADLGYYRAFSTMRRQPLALNAPTSDLLMVMAIDNPYNPYGSRFYHPSGAPNADGTARLTGTPRTVSLTQMTIADLAAETVETRSDALRVSAGLRGVFGQSTWEWDASLFYNEVNGNDEAYPDVRESLLQQALARTDATAFNPFGYTFRVQGDQVVADQPYVNPADVVDGFSDVFARTARSSITSGEFRSNGRLLQWYAGDVLAAAGIEHRRETLRDVRPPFSGENPDGSGLDPTNNDFLLHPPRPDVIGNRDVTSVYAEVAVPLVGQEQSVPLMDSFELTASARFESYSDFGKTTKPKVGANWRPVPWLMVRASRNEGFMAPSLAALYTSSRWSISAGAGDIDTYRNPYLNEGPYVMRTYFGGNPDLKPQESEGRTWGFVLDVPGVQGLSLTADAWRISRTNLLGQRSVGQINASDTALLQAYTREQIAAGVPVDQIDAGSGGANYRGDQDVVRYALTPEDRAAFAAYNAANPDNPAAPVGRILSRNRPFVNIASSEHRGVDFGVRWAMPQRDWGRLTLSSEWSYLQRATSVLAPANVAPIVTEELYGGGAAKWRSTSNINWSNGPWSAGLGIYHIGKTHDGATTDEATWEALGRPGYIEPHYTAGRTLYRLVIDPVVSYNLSVGYQFQRSPMRWMDDTRVRLAIANVTDVKPPLASDNFGYNPGVNQSLLAGRTWSFELTTKF